MISITFDMIPSAFAENPTPYNEWDFDFGEIEIYQNPNDLEEMVILIPVLYKGEMSLGTVDISAKITDPDGFTTTHFGIIHDLKIGEMDSLILHQRMYSDGTYIVDLSMSPPERPYLTHIFDAETMIFEIKPNGLEKEIGTVGIDSEGIVSYALEDPKSVRYFEMVHAVINLPKDHTFENIAVVNGKFVKEYSVDTKDIYIKSQSSYKNMNVKLVKEGNLLPLADAQDTLQDYVRYYVIERDACYYHLCVNIDLVDEPEDFPMWMLVFLGILSIVPFLMKKKLISKKS